MADTKISALPASTLPLAGTEVLPIVQSGATKKVAVDDLTVKNVRSNATNGILQIAGPAAAATRVMTTPDANFTVARTDAAQSFTGNQTLSTGNQILSTGNLVISTSGQGIDFSATPGTGTSELFSDYEEGTFTAVLTSVGGGSITVNSSFDTLGYIKIGRMVYVHGFITISAISTPTGELRLDIPFTTNTSTQVGERGSWGSGGISVVESASGVANGFQIIWSDFKSYVSIYVATGNTYADAAAQMVGGNQTSIRFGFWYPAA